MGGGGRPDVVVTSPPYNLGKKYGRYNDRLSRGQYLDWSEQWCGAVRDVLADDGSFFLNLGYAPRNPTLPFDVLARIAPMFRVQNVIHWIHSMSAPEHGFMAGHFKPVNSARFVNQCHEYVFHLTKSGSVRLDKASNGVPYADKSNTSRWAHGRTTRDRGNVWFVPYEQKNGDMIHPCEFPSALPEMCIRLHGASKDTLVYDPFAGIGSTALACARLGVKSVNTEIDGMYVDIAKERVKNAGP